MPDSSATSPAPRWRGEASPSVRSARLRSSRRRARAALVAGLLAATAAIGGLFYYLTPAPRLSLLPYSVATYRNPQIPSAPTAEADSRGIRREPPDRARTLLGSDSTQNWRAVQNVLEDRSFSGSVLMLYLSAAASCDAAGRVLIWPPDVDLDDPESCLKLHDVLESVRKCKARQKPSSCSISCRACGRPLPGGPGRRGGCTHRLSRA